MNVHLEVFRPVKTRQSTRLCIRWYVIDQARCFKRGFERCLMLNSDKHVLSELRALRLPCRKWKLMLRQSSIA